MSDLFNQELYRFNPFGGIDRKEIREVIVPRISVEKFLELLNSNDQIIIELVGKKGRGKTLHLQFLHQVLQDYPIFLLSAKSMAQEILNDMSDIVFVDSIHHLKLRDRLQLYNTKKKIILTTHITRKLEYLFARKQYKQFKFKGIDKDQLKTIIENRIKNASDKNNPHFTITDQKLETLIKIHNDNFRGILNSLYDEYQIKNN